MAAEEDKQWMRPVAKEGSSNVWKYFELELPDKKRVRCNKCPANTKYFKYSGSTRMMWYHLGREHRIHKPNKINPDLPNAQEDRFFLYSRKPDTQKQSQIQSATAPADIPSEPEAVNSSANVTPMKQMTNVTPLKQMSIEGSFARSYTVCEPKDKIYARMAASDRTSFFTMANSYDVRQRIIKEGHKPYLCHKSIAR